MLKLSNIVKVFPGVRALDNVDFSIADGSVHALLGENGAGKSTLIKILMGLYQKNGGSIRYNGKEVEITSTRDAKNLGIDAVYQDQNLCSDLTVAENLFINRFPRKGCLPFLTWRKMFAQAEKMLSEWKVDFSPRQKIADLNVSQRQIVEIIKIVSDRELRVLILDEPTAALNNEEIEKLFTLIRELKTKGISVIYISHRLDEVFEICDEITVLRDGKNAGSVKTSEASKHELITMMIGRELDEMYPKESADLGDVLLEVKDAGRPGEFEDISFTLRSGEVMGIYGLLGSGKERLGRSLYGLTPLASGSVLYRGRDMRGVQVSESVASGIGYVPANRKLNGIIPILNVKANITLANIGALGRKPLINRNREKERARRWVEELNVKTPGLEAMVGTLSGGNQQKVVIGRWLDADSKLLILNEPTQGIDVGAKREIYRIIEDLCSEGVGIIMISSEIPELVAMCDTVLVLYMGRCRSILRGEEITQESILRYAMTRDDIEAGGGE